MTLFVLISLSCVSAVDNQTNVNAQVDVKVEETLTDVSTDEGNFTALNELISQSENELTLDKNYKFNLSTDKDFDGFTITKDNYVVDGKGHTIDGSNQVRIFIFTGSNITLKNLNIINAKGVNGPAAFFASLAMIDNCSFINNTAAKKVVRFILIIQFLIVKLIPFSLIILLIKGEQYSLMVKLIKI